MKKLILFSMLVLTSFFAFSQFVEGDSLIIYGGGNFESNVQVPDPVNNLDAANKQWVLSQGTVGADSIPFDSSTGDQKLYKGGSVIYTTNFDGRYVLPSVLDDYVQYTDSNTVYVTVTDLNNAISSSSQVVYDITLPNATTVAGRIALAVEGTDYPTGWVLTAGSSPTDIDIEHGLSRYAANATVFVNTGSSRQMLFGSAGFSGVICDDGDNVRLQSLATIPKEITIYLMFD